MAKPISPELRDRLIKVAREEPDLTHRQLGDRFSLGVTTVTNVLWRAGVKREHVSADLTSKSVSGDLKRALSKYRGEP